MTLNRTIERDGSEYARNSCAREAAHGEDAHFKSRDHDTAILARH